MTHIKICGITNVEDARAAVECGAHALGFIFVKESPRCVRRHPCWQEALNGAPPFIARVAVYRGPGFRPFDPIAAFDAVQFYEGFWALETRARRVLACPIRDEESLDTIQRRLVRADADALLLDAYHPDKLGGAGVTFNWDLACEAKERLGKPIILAGGLTPDNVGDAIAAVRPYAVDVSSGVEAEPGRKDHGKLRAFCRAVRKADALLGD